VFPAQAGAELIQDLYASGVIVPTIDFTSVAEGSFLPEFLQTAWDFSTGNANVANATTTLVSNPGFWKVDLNALWLNSNAGTYSGQINISDGLTSKNIWRITSDPNNIQTVATASETFYVFLRSGDSLVGSSNGTRMILDINWRQVADLNGVLVNPLGFTF
jgi:hypothetical protein